MRGTKKLEKKVTKAEKAAAKHPSQPQRQRDLWHALAELSQKIHHNDPTRAAELAQRMVTLAERLVTAAPQADLTDLDGDGMTDRRLLEASLSNLAQNHSGEPRRFIDISTRLVAVQSELATAHPRQPEFLTKLADTAAHAADYAQQVGDDRSTHLHQVAIDAFERLVPISPQQKRAQEELATRLAKFAWEVRATNPHRAIELHTKALQIHRTIAESDPVNPRYQQNLGAALGDLAETTKAVDPTQAAYLFAEGVEITGRLHTAQPENVTLMGDHGLMLYMLASLLWNTDLTRALKTCEESVAVTRKLVAAHPRLSLAAHDLGFRLGQLGKALNSTTNDGARATEILIEAAHYAHQAATAEPANPGFVKNYTDVTLTLASLIKQFDPDQAMTLCDAVIAANKRLAQAAAADKGALQNLANAQQRKARLAVTAQPEHTKPAYDAALQTTGQLVASEPENVDYQQLHGNLLTELGHSRHIDPTEAIEALETAVTIHEWLFTANPNNPEHSQAVCFTLKHLGVLTQQRDPARSTSALRRAAQVAQWANTERPSDVAMQQLAADINQMLANPAMVPTHTAQTAAYDQAYGVAAGEPDMAGMAAPQRPGAAAHEQMFPPASSPEANASGPGANASGPRTAAMPSTGPHAAAMAGPAINVPNGPEAATGPRTAAVPNPAAVVPNPAAGQNPAVGQNPAAGPHTGPGPNTGPGPVAGQGPQVASGPRTAAMPSTGPHAAAAANAAANAAAGLPAAAGLNAATGPRTAAVPTPGPNQNGARQAANQHPPHTGPEGRGPAADVPPFTGQNHVADDATPPPAGAQADAPAPNMTQAIMQPPAQPSAQGTAQHPQRPGQARSPHAGHHPQPGGQAGSPVTNGTPSNQTAAADSAPQWQAGIRADGTRADGTRLVRW